MATDEQLRTSLAETVGEVVSPLLDSFKALLDAVDEFDDDAALGRRAREIVRQHAKRRLDQSIARGGRPLREVALEIVR